MTTYWRVASYGYPNPFGDAKAQRSWLIFLSFVDRPSYQAVKDYWFSVEDARVLSPSALESRKASLEEFGLLYVLAGSDRVVITPGGRQLLAAAKARDEKTFAWVGINLLMRFPLHGPPRSRNAVNVASDFPIYGFIYTALCELQNSIWFEELVRVLSLVTDYDSAQAAIDEIRQLRGGEASFEGHPPMPELKGAYYNSMNQVLNHVSLGGLILRSEHESSPYPGDLTRRETLASGFSEIVRLAIGQRGEEAGDDCVTEDQFIRRMPVVPVFDDEAAYFAYLGARVPEMSSSRMEVEEKLPQVLFGQENVSVLTEGVHYSIGFETIFGDVATLCRVARGQRLILSHDTDWTYKVKDKRRIEEGMVSVVIARSKPISNHQALQAYFVVGAND
jgi:hypothetical protein